jgi:predicted Rossmann-fold nucleotide-binding protein
MVLFGTDYWDSIMNLEKMVEWGTIAERDLQLVHRTDSVDDAFAFLVSALEANEREEAR